MAEQRQAGSGLITDANITEPDAFYEALIAMHRGLSPDESQAVNAKLILLLANHIGDLDVLKEAMETARPEQKRRP